MRPNPIQESSEQKKSVFDRLGRQLDGGRPVNRRSPAQYGEHQMHPGMHASPEYGGGGVRYMRGDGHPEMDWRFQQNDRRNVPFGRDRHPNQVGPPMQMQMHPLHYDMDGMQPGRQPPPYFQQPPLPHFQPGPPPPGPPPQLMGGPDVMPMGMHDQRRPSPKYDRHGNLIRGAMRVDQPPRNFMGPPMPGPMMPHGSYDMMPMRPGIYQPGRWHENPEAAQQMHGGRLLPDDRFMDPMNRFQQQQQQQAKLPMMMNPEIGGMQPNLEAPRYSKWRERRDAITNLDRQTAQSSSKTDSLKSSLQQQDSKSNMSKKSKSAKSDEQPNANKQPMLAIEAEEKKESTRNKATSKVNTSNKKNSPRDISDGEIVDDEDSSDDSDVDPNFINSVDSDLASRQITRHKPGYARKPLDDQLLYDSVKRRRYHERDDCPLDYETISDEELDNFMSEKKTVDDEIGQVGKTGKNSSEIELLNALGLDWANLIELTKQSRKETQTSDSALRRFSLPNYLPTLGITRELAGPEIYEMLMKVVQ